MARVLKGILYLLQVNCVSPRGNSVHGAVFTCNCKPGSASLTAPSTVALRMTPTLTPDATRFLGELSVINFLILAHAPCLLPPLASLSFCNPRARKIGKLTPTELPYLTPSFCFFLLNL